ncbi:MAG: glycosyl hydrolase 115 family protein, partial [Clostridia bacterium]|nr:glycosyl hydrolase 115 family protein [Clostridia bacterium]
GISYNATLANEYGIVMGASHCEMLLCNNETEWEPWCIKNQGKYNLTKINNSWRDSYDYTVNAEAMNAYWEDRVAANYRFENIYTIGLRGLHDSEILCSALTDKSWEGKAAVVQQAVEAQLAILEKYEDIYENETGVRREFATCFCPYKEAAEYYKYDLSLPEDCIILYADDNYGYVRQYPTNTEKETYQGFGVYYHVSYRGAPRSYLWIDSMPLSLMYEEMHKSYTAGSDDLWILNVGDLKPAEFSTHFFLDLAWKESSITKDTLENWMQGFFIDTFALSEADSKMLASLHTEFLQIAYAYRADFQGYQEGTEYAILALGDEAQRTIQKLEDIVKKATAIYDTLPDSRKDSYFETVLYRMRATLFTMQKNVYMQKNAAYLAQGRFASVNAYAALAEEAYQNILKDLNTYNSLQNGKWRGIMDPYITDNGSPVITGAPTVTYLTKDLAINGIGAAAEGQSTSQPVTLTFDSLADNFRFLDIFNTGLATERFTITTSPAVLIKDASGKLLSYTDSGTVRTYSGTVEVESRYFITIDWQKLSSSDTLSLTVGDTHGHSYSYSLTATLQTVDPEAEKEAGNIGYYETNGFVSIEAEHYSDSVAVGDMSWQTVPNLGVSGSSMKCYPDHSADYVRIDGDYENESPYLEYRIYIASPGTFSGICYRIPTLNEGNTDELVHKTCRIAYAFDGGEINYFRGTSLVDTNKTSSWSDGVRHNYEKKNFTVTFTTAGWHTLRVYMADQGNAFDKIVLRRSTVEDIPSRLGYPETFNTVSYAPLPTVSAPVFTQESIPFKDGADNATHLFDFTNDTASVESGYTAVDTVTESAPTKRYAWTEGFSAISAVKRSATNIALRDGSIFYSSQKATFSVQLKKSGTYIVTVVIGDRSSSGHAVSDMAVSVNGTAYLSALSLSAGKTEEHAFVVTVQDATLPITFSGNWVVAAIEIHPYTESKAPSAPVTPNVEGDTVIEAEWALENTENFFHTVSTDGKNFRFMLTGGETNGAVYFGPNANSQYSSTDPATAKTARLSYKVSLTSGTYSVFAYVKCSEDNDDSLILLLDGKQVQVANDFKQTSGDYVPVRIGTITVEEDGIFTLSVFGREDGLAIDKLIITEKTNWIE